MKTTLHGIAFILLTAWIAIGCTSCWGKPHDLPLITHIPWYGWLTAFLGCTLEIISCRLPHPPE